MLGFYLSTSQNCVLLSKNMRQVGGIVAKSVLLIKKKVPDRINEVVLNIRTYKAIRKRNNYFKVEKSKLCSKYLVVNLPERKPGSSINLR